METQNIDLLNKQFAISNHIIFKAGPGGLIVAEINNEQASATVFLHGGQATSFRPNGQESVLFLSNLSHFESGKPIRGGIPVSWPWFADHPTDRTKPAHGFASISTWAVISTEQISENETRLRLGLTNSEFTRPMFPYAFDLEIVINIGKELAIELITRNKGNEAFTITSAFHSYYKVSNIEDVVVRGLEYCTYIDKVDNFKKKMQEGPIKISGETDRIYLGTTNDCLINDPGLKRQIRIQKEGSESTVVWNPWIDKALEMNDLGDKDYKQFVCVETANAGVDLINLAPGSDHRLRANISIESM